MQTEPNNQEHNRRRQTEHGHGGEGEIRPRHSHDQHAEESGENRPRHSHDQHAEASGEIRPRHSHDQHAEESGEPGQRNFWHEWRDERHHHGHGIEIPIGQALSPKEMEAWREFFHKTFGNWPEEHWVFGGRRFSPWHQGIDSFNPFVANLLSKGGGLLPLYVLHLVAQKPRYGNEIMDLLAERTNGQWVSNPGAIYPLLTLLEHEGFIKGEWEDPDKRTVRIYTITQTGQEEVTRITTIVAPKVEETIRVLQEFLLDLQNPGGGSDPQPAQRSEAEPQSMQGTVVP